MSVATDVIEWFSEPARWSGEDGIPNRLLEHLLLTGVTVSICCLVALPIAMWLGHIGKGGTLAINISNVGRAVPTMAVLALLAVTALGFGAKPTVVALVLFGIPPVFTNAYVGVREVDPDMVEAARGMGMTEGQLFRRVELPLALPLIMTGVRLCTVQVIATATLAAVVAGGGLGRFITSGYTRTDLAEVVGGATLVATLALVVEVALVFLERRVDPLRRAHARGHEKVTVAAEPRTT